MMGQDNPVLCHLLIDLDIYYLFDNFRIERVLKFATNWQQPQVGSFISLELMSINAHQCQNVSIKNGVFSFFRFSFFRFTPLTTL